jgi:hypothetical protein
LGDLDSATFVATMLDATVTSYLNAADTIEDVVDHFEERSVSGDGRREFLADLVAVRRRIAIPRRVLTDHRQVAELSPERLVAQALSVADVWLSQAKRSGRNQVVGLLP